MTELAVHVPAELLEVVAQRAAELVLERLPSSAEQAPEGPRWLYGAEKAAGYLDVPLGQVQKLTARLRSVG